ncbi:hypothetical protein HDU97_003540 [Phlyctochytrium planicorne]|nr:hypothetical protein HDU97_003540 [Phlyctochytrium planicorne]
MSEQIGRDPSSVIQAIAEDRAPSSWNDWDLDDSDFNYSSLSQKVPIFCVQVPGEASWVEEATTLDPGSQDDASMTTVVSSVQNLNLADNNEVIRKKIASASSGSKFAVVKLYDDEEVKINDVYEFYGILQAPEQVDFDPESAFDRPIESFGVHVLHCIFSTKVPSHGDPWLDSRLIASRFDPSGLADIALNYLSNVLMGDSLAAEYLLTNLASRIHGYRNGLPIGLVPLNILSVQPTQSQTLVKSLQQITSRCVNIPLTVETLNAGAFAPVFAFGDGDVNDSVYGLASGLLQLASGTTVIFDETVMKPGKLHEKGIRNFHHIKQLLEHGTVEYSFGGEKSHQTREFVLDANCVVLSEGKSMFGLENAIPIAPSSENVASLVDDIGIQAIRLLLGWVKTQDYTISEEMSKKINHDYALRRQDDATRGEKVHTPETLSMKLELARSLSLLSGETQLSSQVWEKAGQMEQKRRNRLITIKK